MNCTIYRCSARTDMYLYLAQEDRFDSLPDTLISTLGQLEKVMELELTPDTHLAKESAPVVIENLQKQGYHLQMPADISTEEILRKIAEQQEQEAEKSRR